MIGKPPVDKNVSYFFLLTFLLLSLMSTFNYIANTRTATALNQLLEEQSNCRSLCRELGCMIEKYDELQESYSLLLEEKEQLEGQLSYRSLSRGTLSSPKAYLTIDDGPGECTPQLLQILSEYKVPATFFVTGQNTSGDEDIYRNILKHGHTLGNHTMTHNFKKIYASTDTFMVDLLKLEERLVQDTGVRPDIVRFPGGTSTTLVSSAVLREIISELKERGYDYFDWNVSIGDCNTSLTAPQLVANLVRQADRQAGQDLVVLMHSFNPATAEALPTIIEELKTRGYVFAALKKGIVNVKHR